MNRRKFLTTAATASAVACLPLTATALTHAPDTITEADMDVVLTKAFKTLKNDPIYGGVSKVRWLDASILATEFSKLANERLANWYQNKGIALVPVSRCGFCASAPLITPWEETSVKFITEFERMKESLLDQSRKSSDFRGGPIHVYPSNWSVMLLMASFHDPKFYDGWG